MKKKIILPLVLPVIVLLVAGGAYGIFHKYYSLLKVQPQQKPAAVQTEPTPEASKKPGEEGIRNILLLGIDARNHDVMTRTDTMIIATVNDNTNTITLTSLMRDIYLPVPGYGSTRLNAATVYGGPNLLIQTIEENFGITIDNYLLTDFFEFKEIVDHFGGVAIEVSAAEINSLNGSIMEYNRISGENTYADVLDPAQAGLVHMNGKQALAYARIRYVGDADFERTQRQRLVMARLIEKTQNMSVGELESLAQNVLPLLTTDITESEMLGLLWQGFTRYKNYELQHHRIPEDGTWQSVMIDGMSVLEINFETNKQNFFKKVYEGQ